MRAGFLFCTLFFTLIAAAQTAYKPYTTGANQYPQQYFRNPVGVPLQLVANFGELRANHWHMGLDVRTQKRENLPVYAAAEGYIAAVSIDATGFGRAIYINHPNGYTTLYAHLNNFAPALHQWVKQQQYSAQRWATKIQVPPNLFPVEKGAFIAYSGNTGGSMGPHVHFEIRDTETDKVLNPLLFGFPIADAVAPALQRLAMYDRSKSIYAQSPQLMSLKRSGNNYSLAAANIIKVGSNRISFAIGAVDFFSGTTNPNGIYSARIFMDDVLQSEFVLDGIDYTETRYLNAQIDYRYKSAGGAYLQHLSKMPGDISNVYTETPTNGVLQLTDEEVHNVTIEVKDTKGNTARLKFGVQYSDALGRLPYTAAPDQLVPGQVNVFEKDDFEVYTSEYAVYDTVNVTYTTSNPATADAVSPVHHFLNAGIPTHDSVTVRIKPSADIAPEDRDRVIIKSVAGSKTVVQKAQWNNGWITAPFRQFGTFQAFVDRTPPAVNNVPADLSKSSRIVFTPTDNFKTIKSVRAEIDGQWLLLTNDKGRSYIYNFDAYFTRGTHQLNVTVEDVAGNVTTKEWTVRR
jgi:hypothetical protein